MSFRFSLSLWVRAEWTGGRSRPVPFEFKAVPRFAETEGILKETLELYE